MDAKNIAAIGYWLFLCLAIFFMAATLFCNTLFVPIAVSSAFVAGVCAVKAEILKTIEEQ